MFFVRVVRKSRDATNKGDEERKTENKHSTYTHTLACLMVFEYVSIFVFNCMTHKTQHDKLMVIHHPMQEKSEELKRKTKSSRNETCS